MSKSGHVSPVLLTLSLIADRAGNSIGIATIAKDITTHKQNESKLLESEERFSLIAQATLDGLWDYEMVQGTVWRGEECNRMFGMTSGARGESLQWWLDRIHPDDRPSVEKSFREAIAGDGERWCRECIEEIKADKRLRCIPIVVLTSSCAGEDIVHSCDNGASSYIRKPVTFNQLVEVVKAIGGYWFSIVELPEGAQGENP